jgi:hypothetical protein
MALGHGCPTSRASLGSSPAHEPSVRAHATGGTCVVHRSKAAGLQVSELASSQYQPCSASRPAKLHHRHRGAKGSSRLVPAKPAVSDDILDGSILTSMFGAASEQRQLQISKARQTAIGSALVLRPRYLAVLSICTWPKSARTVCKSPVPFKMWRAFVRRKDSTL